ncbi:hypothetical protein EV651_117135 [Kribbella sp. VKM Ac-2571]|nr:hypothetical protein EV651_117135 [Kribbella sp. VKM Ac-2571]
MKVGRRTVNLSNTDKVLFPDDGVTKGDLIEYYETVGSHMTQPSSTWPIRPASRRTPGCPAPIAPTTPTN